ncbi:hypothetical protein GDO86_014537 [Hymenochirus boettgeri]|uniref:Uncharacterized protein n=1 Tax=Hymenochirus boettgeri TaxID=247094 RepID=A0A8T2JTC1_9PIPI|nr:hypothetical protein GDO86_014537 [Hymenochirus boettgeri]
MRERQGLTNVKHCARSVAFHWSGSGMRERQGLTNVKHCARSIAFHCSYSDVRQAGPDQKKRQNPGARSSLGPNSACLGRVFSFHFIVCFVCKSKIIYIT